MMNIKVFAHDYQSGSVKIDNAIAAYANDPKSDGAFRNLICTIVDEAARGAKLYAPYDPDRKSPVPYHLLGTTAFALYTDPDLANACARATIGMRHDVFPMGQPVALSEIIDRDGGQSTLAFNLGLPHTVVLPPNVVHTIRHLLITHVYHTKEPEDSSWNEWIDIMERYFAEQPQDQDAPEATASHREDVELRLPIRREDPGLTIPPDAARVLHRPADASPRKGGRT